MHSEAPGPQQLDPTLQTPAGSNPCTERLVSDGINLVSESPVMMTDGDGRPGQKACRSEETLEATHSHLHWGLQRSEASG